MDSATKGPQKKTDLGKCVFDAYVINDEFDNLVGSWLGNIILEIRPDEIPQHRLMNPQD
jgi:hypothetical protein